MNALTPEQLSEIDKMFRNGRGNAVLYANVHQQNIKIIVSRVHRDPRRWPDVKDFTASGFFGGREIAEHGMLPSHAVAQLVKALQSATCGNELEAAAINSDLPATVN